MGVDFANLQKTPERLKKIKSLLNRNNRQYARMKFTERKQDTRRKIQLGGLVIKAGLENETTAVILGLLLEAAENLQSKACEKFRTDYRIKGDIALTKEKEIG